MGFKKAADGIVKKGKTDVHNFGDSGAKVLGLKGPKKSGGAGKTNDDMKAMGRNLAKLANQKRG
jgi:hypothetical protein